MPFMRGRGAVRRTLDYLNKGDILLRPNIRVMTFNFTPGKRYPHHNGLYEFVYWHLPQLKFKNSEVQFVTFKKMTPSPFIMAYLDDDSKILVDCDSRQRQEIYDHTKKIFGKSQELLESEAQREASRTANPANFGYTFARQCICEVPGQVPCPGWQPLPLTMTGKGRKQLAEQAEDS